MKSALSILLLLTPFWATGQVSLVEDINPGAASSFVNAPFFQNGAVLLFTATEPAHDAELWRSDGTEAGTYRLTDLFASPTKIGVFQGKFWYLLDGKLHKSNGTAAGTSVVKTFTNPTFYYGPVFAVFKNELYFSYGTSSTGEELWKTDGTTAGTVMVKDINPGASHGRPDNFMVIGDLMLFNAWDGVNGFELWKTDGTTAGTTLVKDIRPGTGSAITNGVGTPIGAFFIANDGTHGTELWVSDGTDAGTHMVKDIDPNGNGVNSVNGTISHGYVNGKVVFIANDGANGDEPWSTDGTEAGTAMIKNIGTDWQHGTFGSRMWVFQDHAFFTGVTNTPWVTDGTEAGTLPLNASLSTSNSFVQYNGQYAFIGINTANERQIWETDGTPGGTQVLADLVPGNFDDNFNSLIAVSNTLFMWANDGTHGLELFSLGGPVVSIASPTSLMALTIQPNPARDQIRLDELPEEFLESGRLDIFGWTGQKLKSWDVQADQSYELDGLPAGTYWLQLTSGAARRVGKLVVIR